MSDGWAVCLDEVFRDREISIADYMEWCSVFKGADESGFQEFSSEGEVLRALATFFLTHPECDWAVSIWPPAGSPPDIPLKQEFKNRQAILDAAKEYL